MQDKQTRDVVMKYYKAKQLNMRLKVDKPGMQLAKLNAKVTATYISVDDTYFFTNAYITVDR